MKPYGFTCRWLGRWGRSHRRQGRWSCYPGRVPTRFGNYKPQEVEALLEEARLIARMSGYMEGFKTGQTLARIEGRIEQLEERAADE